MRLHSCCALLAATFITLVGLGADTETVVDPNPVRMSAVPVEAGVVVIGNAEDRDLAGDVALYKASRKEKQKPRFIPGVPIALLAVGPQLDASDTAKVIKVDTADKKITATITYTSAKVRGADTSKSKPATPVAKMPIMPPTGDISVKVIWQCTDKPADANTKKPADIVQETKLEITEG